MRCQSVAACFEEIKAYCNNISTGYPFIADTEDYDVFNQLMTWLRSDPSKRFIYVSDFCDDTGLPRILDAYVAAFSEEDNVLVGLSQACMLRSKQNLEETLDMLLGEKAIAHTVVLLDHCREYLLKHCKNDVRLDRRIVFVENYPIMPLPQISLVHSDDRDIHSNAIPNIRQLLMVLEQMTNEKIQANMHVSVCTNYPVSLFKHAIYSVVKSPGIYEKICQQYSDIANATNSSYGTDEQWRWLAKKLREMGGLSQLVLKLFHSFDMIEFKLSDVLEDGDELEKWLYWLILKVHKTQNNYLNEAVIISNRYQDLEQAIYFTLLDKNKDDVNFLNAYKERKAILKKLPENIKFVSRYCNEIGKKDKNAAYFLTDMTKYEQMTLIRLISQYSYDRESLNEILNLVSPELNKYMKDFLFTTNNSKLADDDLALELTSYFKEYKWQKLTNKIEESFLHKVEKTAAERPYNRLLTRTAVIKNLQCRSAKPYFVDALGVEYLSYIIEKCHEYGMLVEVHIGHADLPSITECNKDFANSFDSDCTDVKDLDELKHGANHFNYEKVKYPIHLISELDIIDRLLKSIQSALLQEQFHEAVIVSDHGASRLAVIHETENDSMIELSERGKHSGRCCPVDANPEIPFAAYENGYAILANYDRFKGSRKADVEVHGGATLEEVLVPIIRLSIKPDKLTYTFVESVIYIKVKQDTTLVLFCNAPMNRPRLFVKNKFYDGVITTDDQKHAKFILDDIHRKNIYKAEIYEGDTSMGVTLEFEIKKQTHEVDFGI